MRTAREILDVEILKNNVHSTDPFDVFQRMEKSAVAAINSAREEIIKECAERAKSEWVRYGTQMGHQVEKESILSLINELK